MEPQPLLTAETRIFEGKSFPLTMAPSDFSAIVEDDGNSQIRKHQFHQWARENSGEIDNLLREHKAILFRGFLPGGCDSHNDFHDFVVATGLQEMDYIGGAAVRTQLTPRVFTANESPSSEIIPFHHEMAQTPHPPTHLFFYCAVAPAEGGETPLLVSMEVYDLMFAKHPSFMQRLEEEGVRYVIVMPEEDDPTSAIGRGWKSTLNARNRDEAELALNKLGSSWEWLADGSCRTITVALPAVRIDNKGEGRSNRKVFFNSIVAAYTGWNDSRNNGRLAVVTAGDNLPLEEDAMDDAVRIMEEVSVPIKWRAGDVLLVDNRTCMHARRNFVGPRRILAALARDHNR